MLDDNAFLRRLPVAVEIEQALLLEALVYAADSADVCLAVIRQTIDVHGKDLLDADRRTHIHLLVNAWGIVDSIHAAMKMLEALDFTAPTLAQEFFDAHKVATVLRNKMDHIHQQARNLAYAKVRPPLLGALTFAMLDRDPRENDLQGSSFVISTGKIRSDGQVFEMVNPAGQMYYGRVGGLNLQAFGQRFALEQACRDLDILLVDIDAKLEKDITEGITNSFNESKVAEGSATLAEHLAPPAGGLSLRADFNSE